MQITQRVSILITMISGWKVELQCDVSEDHKLIDKLCVATDLRSVLYSLDSNCQIPRRDSEGLLVLKNWSNWQKCENEKYLFAFQQEPYDILCV